MYSPVPVLSVIIPVYNTQEYLQKCLDSIINQTMTNIEIICVNDGSTDNSLSILENYQKIDSRINIINKKNGGLSSARNIGIEHAKGKYIAFVDSDDYIELSTYERALLYIELPNVDLVYFSTRLEVEHNFDRLQDESYFEHKYKGLINLSPDVIRNMDVCAWNKIYKLSMIEKYSIRFPDGLWYEDNPFFWSYALVSDSAFFLNDKLYNYRIRASSIMSWNNDKTSKLNYKTNHKLDPLLCFESLLHFVFKWSLVEKFKPVLVDLFMQKIYESLHRLSKKERKLALMKSTEIARTFNLDFYFPNDQYINSLIDKCYYKIPMVNHFFLTKKQRFWGVWDADKYFIFCFLGIKIKIKKQNF